MPSTQVVELAGHSVAVLHQIYAKVIAGVDGAAHAQIEKAMDWDELGKKIGNKQP